MATLAVRDLTAGYRELDIVHGVSLHVEPGEIVTIIGPNGAGKSTLLRSIFGLVPPRRGAVTFMGEDVTGERPDRLVRKGMCFVPQNCNVFPRLTVEENLEMGAFVAPSEARERMAAVYELFPPLKEKRRTPAGVLSGGQQQMVAIGRALMMDPKLLLLDEPTAGLSPAYQRLILEKVVEINAADVPILMIEQNAKAALAISHRGYVLTMGRNRLDGRAADLLSDPEVGQLFLGG
ncbi:MAG: ABC transporter ATP-binding protein [Firmicutes bacterium]|nr:ABC transporter ATP-binding protein [Bacillota bacterium]